MAEQVERIAAIAARLAAATPGDWYDEFGNGFIRTMKVDNIAFVYGAIFERKANATFIANAPADIAWLLGELAKYQQPHIMVIDATTGDVITFPNTTAAPTLAAMRAEEGE